MREARQALGERTEELERMPALVFLSRHPQCVEMTANAMGAHVYGRLSGDAATGTTVDIAPCKPSRDRPLLLGHRGARPLSRYESNARVAKIPPENTLPAFEYALANGCDGFELDVRVTRDGRLILCHNAWLSKRKVAASSYDGLCTRRGERLPCLEDVLTAFADRAFLDIEIKVCGAEELLVRALRQRKPRRYLLSSFLPDVLRRFHQLDASLPLGYICDRLANVRNWRKLPIQVFLPQSELVSEKLVGEVHSQGLNIFTWTVNREADIRRLAAWGIDGLISDDPKLLSRSFRSRRVLPKSEGRKTNSTR